MSVATLGFAVDSAPLNAASKALDGLTAAAKPAQSAANLLKQSFSAVQDSLSKLIAIQQASLTQQSAMASSFDKLSQSLGKVNREAPTVVTATTAIDREAKSTAVSVTSAGKALDGLTTAAKPAEKAVKDLGTRLTDLSALEKALDRAVADINVGLVAQRNGTAAASKSLQGMSFEAKNLGFQLVDVTQGLVSGQPVFMIAAQQLGQIGQIIATSPQGLGGLMKELGRSIAGLLTPMRLVTVGIVGIGAGALAAVSNVAKLSLQFEDTARAAGASVAQLQGFAAAASFKGIGNDDFLTAMDKFSASVYDAKNNMGGLAEVLRANHKTAGTLVQDFGSVSDLIKSASGNTQLQFSILSQAGLPATMQWVRFLSQGKDVIAAQTAEFMKNGDQMDALAAKARAFQEAWDKAITNLKFGFQSAILSVVGFFDNLGDKVTSLLMRLPKIGSAIPTNILRNAMNDNNVGYTTGSKLTGSSPVDQFYSPLGKSAPGNAAASAGAVDPNALQHAIQLEQQHIALLGQTASAADAVRAVELQVQQARLAGVPITQKQVDVLKKLTYEQSIGVTQIKSQVDSYNMEAAAIGMSAGAAAQYYATQSALNDARRAGKTLTDADVAAITAQASALGDAAAKADLMRTAYSGLVQGPLQTLTSQIANGAKFFDALKSAGISALNAIASKLAEMAAQSLWTNALGGGSSGGGLIGMLGNLFGGGAFATAGLGGLAAIHHAGGIVGDGAAPMRSVNMGMFAAAPRFHTGLMPDEFPAILQKGEGVFTRGQMAAMGGAANSNTPQDVNINVNVSGARGNQEITDAVNAGVGQALATYRKSTAFVQDVGMANQKAGKLRVGRG